MTRPDPAKFAHYARQTILSVLLTGIGAGAFRLSYDAQVDLAIVAGVRGTLAGLYPIIVDAVILLTTLIRIWNKPDTRSARVYIWAALGFWTATSVLGNAYHVVAAPAAEVRIPIWIAIALNAIPALSLFIAIHLATTMAFRHPTVAAGRPARRRPQTEAAGDAIASLASIGVTDEQLLDMADNQDMSVRAIALELGIGKTAVANRLRGIRDRQQDLAS